MSSDKRILSWQKEVQRHFQTLSAAQSRVLGQWSYGMVQSHGCGITRVSHWLAKLLKCPPGRLRQRLREWNYEAEAKRGPKRREVQVEACFGELLVWALEGWEGKKEVVLALDPTTLTERFTALCINVLIRGCAIPVAWTLLPANQPGRWKPLWLKLLSSLSGAIPSAWKVVVMADQGLYAAWLFRAIRQQGWHPLLRVSEQMGMRAQGEKAFRPLGARVRRRGRPWQGQGEWSERGERVSGSVMICWERGYERKLAVVSDLPLEEVKAGWYQMRFWIEGGFKDQKRGGLHWEQTKMSDPGRASRLWLAMAVALLWMARVGCEEEGREQQALQRRRTPRKRGRPAKPFFRPRGREQSCVMRGQQSINLAVDQESLPLGHLVGEDWPDQWYVARRAAPCWKRKSQTRKRTKRRRQKETQARIQQQRRAKQREEGRKEHQVSQEARRMERLQRQEQREAQREADRQQLARQYAQRQERQTLQRRNRLGESCSCSLGLPARPEVPQRRQSPPQARSTPVTHVRPSTGILKGEPPHAPVRSRSGRLVPVKPPCVQQIPP